MNRISRCDTGRKNYPMFWCFIPNNKSFIDQACSVKMAGYRARFFACQYDQAPDYICNLIRVKNPSLYSLRSNSQVLLVPPFTKTNKTLGDRAFTAAAPSLWNKLPCAIREEDNFNHFKSKLKTFLFRKTFE